MYLEEILAVVCYFILLLTIGFLSYRKHNLRPILSLETDR